MNKILPVDFRNCIFISYLFTYRYYCDTIIAIKSKQNKFTQQKLIVTIRQHLILWNLCFAIFILVICMSKKNIPDNIKEPRAAILYVCGHSPSQKVRYQAHPRKFAQMGFVCLVIETIQFGEVRGDHWGCYAKGWFNWYSRGYNPAGVELWNAIRGIDLLTTRPEVDPQKLGVTGISVEKIHCHLNKTTSANYFFTDKPHALEYIPDTIWI